LGLLPRQLHTVDVDEQCGEFFFSSPIDPFDLSKDWADQTTIKPPPAVINGGVNTSMAPADTVGPGSRTDSS